MTRSRFLTLGGTGLLLAACGHKRSRVANLPPASTSGRQAPINPSEYVPETGIASWYGHPFHGRQSASGEIYDMEQMTAAHRTLTFGTVVHVENLDNGMSAEVRINDRGPFVGNRIIDLSHAAAGAINMIGPGTARVRLTVVGAPAVPEPAVFAIQVAAFLSRENADRMQAKMQGIYGAATLRLRTGAQPLWRVLVGHAASTESAETLARQIRSEQSAPEAFVVRLDPVLGAPLPNSKN